MPRSEEQGELSVPERLCSRHVVCCGHESFSWVGKMNRPTMVAFMRPVTSSAFDVLRIYLEAPAASHAGDFDLIRSVFLFKRLPAGEFLQRAGDVTRHAAFVASGCLRNYVIDAKGKEHIVQFAPETWWLADATSLNNGTPST